MGNIDLFQSIRLNDENTSYEEIDNVDVNHRDIKARTSLHYAANHKVLEIAELILNSGGALNIENDYGNQPTWTALFNARGNYEIVKCFLKFKPDIRHKNRAGRSPLDFANQINYRVLVNNLNAADASS
ncbi:ankyrin repeat domain-containing protein [Methylomonas albis]|uniref:Ankyrin repeat domain-containing protein n=1 Tax=Methylomonas albis TaxID=1854563 RepID=A0ABR9CVS1_9GAMM|nr:ankyrin repeat domain-containing protein [Methylomonas albis]MBD9354551.1 ankyrin repeat domain-containing protein [Methylomonas albis]